MLTSSRYRSLAVLLFYFALVAGPRPAHAQDAKAQPSIADKNQRAHALLDAASKVNGLTGDDVKPWHLKGTLTWYGLESTKPDTGAVEKWSTGRYQWRMNYVSKTSTSKVWSVSRMRMLKPKKDDSFAWEPVSDPLSGVRTIKPDYELDLLHLNVGVALDCVSVVHPGRYKKPIYQQFFPVLCFDEKLRLRLESWGSYVTQYDAYQTFQNHAVAGNVKEAYSGKTLWEYKQTALEALSPGDEILLKPDKDAVSLPHSVEFGDPQPVPIYRAAGSTYLQADDVRKGEILWIPIVIQKDGSVRAQSGQGAYLRTPGTELLSSNGDTGRGIMPLFDAAVQWRFEPYIVDGSPVEINYLLPFTEDGQPWGQW